MEVKALEGPNKSKMEDRKKEDDLLLSTLQQLDIIYS
jgi:hypothetical protein